MTSKKLTLQKSSTNPPKIEFTVIVTIINNLLSLKRGKALSRWGLIVLQVYGTLTQIISVYVRNSRQGVLRPFLPSFRFNFGRSKFPHLVL